jgi:hypothetical protein
MPKPKKLAVPRKRLHYLPFDEVRAGMVLGRPVSLTEANIVRYALPAGHELTEDNLNQLAAHRADFICIAVDETRSPDEIDADAMVATTRVLQAFVGADLSKPTVAALFDRVLAYRSR